MKRISFFKSLILALIIFISFALGTTIATNLQNDRNDLIIGQMMRLLDTVEDQRDACIQQLNDVDNE